MPLTHVCVHCRTRTLHVQEKLLLACEEVRAAGEEMHKTASEFAKDTLPAEKRDAMVQASQELLKAVTRLMVIADTVDVSKLLKASSRVRSAAFWLKRKQIVL